MNKISKLNMFYNHVDAQSILVMMNIKAPTSGSAPPATTVITQVPSLAPIIEIPTLVPEVDQITNSATILSARETTPPPISIRRI